MSRRARAWRDQHDLAAGASRNQRSSGGGRNRLPGLLKRTGEPLSASVIKRDAGIVDDDIEGRVVPIVLVLGR